MKLNEGKAIWALESKCITFLFGPYENKIGENWELINRLKVMKKVCLAGA